MMILFHIVTWIIYGVVVGFIAGWVSKKLHTGDEPVGWLGMIGTGIAGSFIGGMLSWLVGFGSHPFHPAGLLMGVIGGVIFCWAYHYYDLQRFLKN